MKNKKIDIEIKIEKEITTYKYFIKLWDDEKIEIDEYCFNKLEHGTWISVLRVKKIGYVTIPLKNIKLWYRIENEK